jgi:hypothetical protein
VVRSFEVEHQLKGVKWHLTACAGRYTLNKMAVSTVDSATIRHYRTRVLTDQHDIIWSQYVFRNCLLLNAITVKLIHKLSACTRLTDEELDEPQKQLDRSVIQTVTPDPVPGESN